MGPGVGDTFPSIKCPGGHIFLGYNPGGTLIPPTPVSYIASLQAPSFKAPKSCLRTLNEKLYLAAKSIWEVI